jgi:hypothetical protein
VDLRLHDGDVYDVELRPIRSYVVARPRFTTLVIWLLVLIGIGGRFLQFWRNDSLMLDECALCLNIGSRDLAGFTRTLGYDQAAPLGFLVLQKAAVASVGTNDVITRIVPFIFGILTIALVVLLSHRIFKESPSASLLAIGLVCLNRRVIEYGATAKQYSVECSITLMFMLALAECIGPDGDSSGSPSTRTLLILSPSLMWLSYGAVFVVGGTNVALVCRAVVLRRRESWKLAICYGASALFMLVPFYLLSMRPASANRTLAADWTVSYMPLWPPEAAVSWLYHNFAIVGEMLVHKRLELIVPLALIAVALHAVYSRSWFWIAGLVSILLILGASALHYYPFSGRLLLFLVPVFSMILADAVKLVERRFQLAAALVTATLLIGALSAFSLDGILRHRPIDNVRKAHKEMMVAMVPGDQLWVSYLATPCFLYYLKQYPLKRGVYVHLMQRDERPILPGGRNWLLVMRTPWEPGEGETLLASTQGVGKEVLSFDVELTTARLFAIRNRK